MSDTPTKTQLNKLKVAELRGQLTELGLATNGIKADLVQRLFTHYQEQEAEAEQAVRGPVITLRGSTPSRKSPVAVKKARTTSSLEVLRSQKTAIVAQDLMNMTIYDAQGKFLFLEF